MKNLFIVMLIGVMSFGVASCKKKNLTKDQWKISKATDLEDNSDITADYAGEVWEFEKDGTYKENGTVDGTWEFTDGKENLIITGLDNTTDSYKVIELKKNSMILEELEQERIELIKN